ncbi:MAG: TonB-dependent receptor [Sphingomonadaceae bacterium]
MALRIKISGGLGVSALALAVSAVALPSIAQAQDTVPAEEEQAPEITVTGFRQSIVNAAAQKRTSTSIVEVISAEDIGKLPDASIGEALSRLPGLAAQRFDGRSSKLSIRGLAPDFTTTTLNGREMVSSDNNRAVEFDQFPSELLSGAVVYKTPDASLTAQAIGGTVDLKTMRPLSQKSRVLVVGLRGELNDKGKLNPDTSDKGYRANITYIDQNADGTVGWALGYARMVQPIQEQYVHTWGYSNLGTPSNPQLFIDGIKPYVKSNELTRDGFMGTLEFRPTDSWNLTLDAFYSKFNDEQTLRGQEIAGYTASSRAILDTSPGGVVTEGRWNNVRTMSRNDFSDRKSDNFAAGLNSQHELGGGWSLEFDGSYSTAKRTFSAYETYSSTGRGGTGLSDTITYTLGGSNGLVIDSGLNYADPSLWRLGDNLGWGGPLCTAALGWQCASQDGFVNEETSKDDLTAFKLAVKREMDGAISGVRFGAKYSLRTKTHTREGQFLTLNAYPALLPIPSNLLVEPANLGFMGLGNTISYDARALVASGVYYFSPENALTAGTNSWSVNENVLNLYAMADLNVPMGGMNLTGNIGVQAVHTDQSSKGVAGTNNGGVISLQNIDQGAKYWDILPSANLILNINDDNKLRFGVARVLARARMDQMNSSRTFSFDPAKALNTDIFNSPWGGGGGNPMLRPWRSWQFDLSFEHYFGKGGYVAIAPFYKHLENYVYDSQVLVDFTGITAPGPIQPTLTQGFIGAPDNGKGGKIYGLELTASLPLGSLTDALDGFGLIGSASFTRSEVRRTASSQPEQLPGLSRNVLNGTFYYEGGGFGARVSVRHRSSFLAESFAIGLSRQLTMAKGETIFDAQVSYDLSNAGIKGLTVYLQGSNLTDEPFVQYYNNDPTQFRHWHTYGRNFMAGVTYKF